MNQLRRWMGSDNGMRRRYFCATCIAIFAVALTQTSMVKADFLIGATGISSPQGSFPGSPLEDIINQSGLTNTYQSGVTVFDGFVASTLHTGVAESGFTNTNDNGPQQFIFDLGEVLSIDAIGIWNSGSAGSIISFELLADDDDDFSNGTVTQLLGPTNLDINGAIGQAFEFGPVSTRYVVINGLDTTQPPDFYGLGEVVFRTSVAIPEPGLSLIALSSLSICFCRTRRRTATS